MVVEDAEQHTAEWWPEVKLMIEVKQRVGHNEWLM
jgi:hypothetical protein